MVAKQREMPITLIIMDNFILQTKFLIINVIFIKGFNGWMLGPKPGIAFDS